MDIEQWGLAGRTEEGAASGACGPRAAVGAAAEMAARGSGRRRGLEMEALASAWAGVEAGISGCEVPVLACVGRSCDAVGFRCPCTPVPCAV